MEGSKGGLSFGTRNNLKDTDDGNKRIDVFLVAFDGASNDNNDVIILRYGKDIVSIYIKYSLYLNHTIYLCLYYVIKKDNIFSI